MGRSFTLYGFIEDVQPIWLSRDERQSIHGADSGLADEERPLQVWIEVDCIVADHFRSIVESPVPKLDTTTWTPGSADERRELLTRLLRDPDHLKTLYFVAGKDSDWFPIWQELLVPSRWLEFSVTPGDRRIDISDREAVSLAPRNRVVLLAEDPYTGEAWIVDEWRIEPVEKRIAADLAEVINLNHIRDIPLPPHEDGGGTVALASPLLWPRGGPPLAVFSEEAQFTLKYGSTALEYLRKYHRLIHGVDIYFEPEARGWTMCHEGMTYFSREAQAGNQWYSPGVKQLFSLIAIADEVFFCPEDELQMQSLWETQKSRAEQIITIGKMQAGSTQGLPSRSSV